VLETKKMLDEAASLNSVALAVADAEGRFQARQFTVHGCIGRAFADP
jgi:hypothetical protein